MLKITKNERNIQPDADSFIIETETEDRLTVWFWKRHIAASNGGLSIVPERVRGNGRERPFNLAYVFNAKELQQFITFLTEESNKNRVGI